MQDSDMKKLVTYALFLCLAIGLNNLFNTSLRKHQINRIYDNLYSFEWIKTLPHKPEIIFLGSSTTKGGFSASFIQNKLNLPPGSVITISTTPNNPDIAYFLISRYLPYLADDAIIFYGLDPWILSRSYYRHFSNLLSDWTIGERIDYLIANYKNRTMCLNVMNGGSITANLQNLVIGANCITLPENYGNKIIDQPKKLNLPRVDEMFEMDNYAISSMFLDKLKQMDQLLNRNNKLLVVYFPHYSESFVRQAGNKSYVKLIISQIDKNIDSGVTELDIMAQPDSLFYDMVHFNQAGAFFNQARILELVIRYRWDQP